MCKVLNNILGFEVTSKFLDVVASEESLCDARSETFELFDFRKLSDFVKVLENLLDNGFSKFLNKLYYRNLKKYI